MNRAERRRAEREAQKPQHRRRAHRAVARAQGCRCQPDVVVHVDGIGADMFHERGCALEHAGTKVSVIVQRGGVDLPVLFDADAAIDLAVSMGTLVLAVVGDDPVMIAPAGVDLPPLAAEWCNVETVTRLDGATVRLATIPDEAVAAMTAGWSR